MKRMLVIVVLGSLTPLVASVLLQLAHSVHQQREAGLAGLKAKANAMGTLAVDVIGPNIAFADAAAIDEGLGYLATDADFDFALALGPKGEPVGYRGDASLKAARLAAGATPVTSPGSLGAAFSVNSAGKFVGTIVLGLKTANVEAAISQQTRATALISFAGIVISALVVLLLVRAIARNNSQMRSVLDAVDQALLNVYPDGRVAPTRSRTAEKWFGDRVDASLHELFGQHDPKLGEWLAVAWEDTRTGALPIEVVEAQLPTKYQSGDRHYRIEYKRHARQRDGHHWLVMVSDVTAEMLREQSEKAKGDLMRLVELMAKDRLGTRQLLTEAKGLLSQIEAAEAATPELQRALHTFKGACAVQGLDHLAHLAHALEDRLAEGAPLPVARQPVIAAWAELESRLSFLLESDPSLVEVRASELLELATEIAEGRASNVTAERLRAMTRPPVRRSMERLEAQVHAVARKVGLEGLQVEVDCDGAAEPPNLAPFWSSLVHIARNAVDHGLETAQERVELGKSPAGRVRLSARHHGVELVVEVTDDGRGIDFEKLAKKAAERGLPKDTREALVEVLFADGVSTRDTVTELSGRGVGLGAVRQAVNEIGGKIEIESTLGAGTTFRFRLKAA